MKKIQGINIMAGATTHQKEEKTIRIQNLSTGGYNGQTARNTGAIPKNNSYQTRRNEHNSNWNNNGNNDGNRNYERRYEANRNYTGSPRNHEQGEKYYGRRNQQEQYPVICLVNLPGVESSIVFDVNPATFEGVSRNKKVRIMEPILSVRNGSIVQLTPSQNSSGKTQISDVEKAANIEDAIEQLNILKALQMQNLYNEVQLKRDMH